MEGGEVVREGVPSQQQRTASGSEEEQKRQVMASAFDNYFPATEGLQQEPGSQQQQHDRLRQQDSGGLQQLTPEQRVAPESGTELLLHGASSSQVISDNSFSQWKRHTRRWLKGAVLYARCRPLLVASFIFFSVAHVLLSVTFLRLFPCPLLLTWAQLSQSVFYAFVLGEAGDAFAAFRSLFPSTSRTLHRAFAAVAGQTIRPFNRPHNGAWQSSTAPGGRSRQPAGGGDSASSAGGETAAEVFWKHRSGLLLQLLLRLLPYSLGYCLLQYAHNVLAAHVLHPLQLPIVSSLSLAAQELLYSLYRKANSSSKAAGGSGLRRHNSSSLGPPPERGLAAPEEGGPGYPQGEAARGRLATAAANAQAKEKTTANGAAAHETELTAAESLSAETRRACEGAPSGCFLRGSEGSGAAPSGRSLLRASRCCLLPSSRLMQLLSLLLLGGGPGLYIYWQSSSSLFAAAAVLFVLASLVYRSWLLPKALHLPRCSNNGIKGTGAAAAAQQLPAASSSQRAEESHQTAPAAQGSSSFFSPLLSLHRLSSPAVVGSCFRPKEISLLQNLTGALLLLLPGLLCGEQHYTTFPFRFLLSHRWDDWLDAGCWISLGTVSFLRRTTSSSIMREAGASIWKAAELLALLCVGCCSCFLFGNPGPAAAACCCVMILGRLLSLAAAPLVVPHRRHHHHADTLLLEKQQLRILPSSSAAAVAVGSLSRPAAGRSLLSQGGHSSRYRDRPPSRGALSSGNSSESTLPESHSSQRNSDERSSSTQARGIPAAALSGRISSDSNSSSRITAVHGRGDYASQGPSGPLVSQSFSSTYSSRDDMPSFSFPSSGRRSFSVWSAEAASRAAAAAELPGVRLLEEPDIFLRSHRGYPFGRRFGSAHAPASFEEYAAAPSLRDTAAALPWERAASQALLAEDHHVSGRAAADRGRGALSVIGEEEEEEEGGRPRTTAPEMLLPALAVPSAEDVAPPAAIALPQQPEVAAAGEEEEADEEEEEEEETDEEEAAAAAKRGFLMEIVRAYVGRTAFEDLLLLEEWGGTTGVATAVGADLLQGLPDERRHVSSSSSSENEEGSITEDEETEEEEHFAAIVTEVFPSRSSAPAVFPSPSGCVSRVSSRVAADSAAASAAAARAWPATPPPRRRRPQRRVLRGRQQQSLARDKQTAPGADAAVAGGADAAAAAEDAAVEAGEDATIAGMEEVVLEQRRLYGVNRLPRRPLSSFFSLCLEAASDATLKVLMFCGLMSLVLALLFSKEPETEVIEGLAIWVAVLVVVLVTAGNDWMKEQQFALLSAVKEDKKCAVIRGGEAKQLSVFDVVVGDLLQLEAGDEIPADALLVQGRDVKVDESSLTGESDPIAKEAFLVCMREVSQLHRQQHQQQPAQDLPSRAMIPKKSSPQQQQTPQQQHHDEEREPVAASTAAESTAPPLSAATLQQEYPAAASITLSPSPMLPTPGSALHASSSADAPSHETLQPPTSTRPGAPNNSAVGNATAAGGGVAAGTETLSPVSSSSLAVSPSVGSLAVAGGVSPPEGASRYLLARHHLVPSPVLLSGTTLSTGSCTALVVAVGSYSQVGQTFQKLAFDPEPTPLQMKLNALAEDIGNFGLAAAVVAFVVLLLEFWLLFWLQRASARQTTRAVDILHEHVEFFVTAITILVVAVPEGLPLAVTISLAYSISQMLMDQNYVRRLAACEIMGGANEICSDKTGTLTKNQMTVTVFWQGTSPQQQQQQISSSLLLYIPQTAAATTATRDKEDAQSRVSSAADATPLAKKESLEDGGACSGPKGRSGAAVAAAGFSKDYTQPLLEAELSTTARSTEAEKAAATRRGGGFGGDSSRDDQQESKYAAWMQGEKTRQHQRKWLLLAEAIAANSTAFLEREEDGSRTKAAEDTGDETAASMEQQPAAATSREEAAAAAETRYKHVGSPTECALLAFSMFHCHKNYAFLRKQLLGAEDCNLLERREFTSDRKMMTTIIRLSPEAMELETRFQQQQKRPTDAPECQSEEATLQQQNDQKQLQHQQPRVGGFRIFVKGAAERVLHQCSRVLVSDDEEYALTPSLISTIEGHVINTMAARALRTICIAYKDLPPEPQFSSSLQQQDGSAVGSSPPSDGSSAASRARAAVAPGASSTPSFAASAGTAGETAAAGDCFDAFERDLICLGIAGIEDPVREEVPEAVLQCQAAGIRVRMVTGDNLLTATAIAAQCNIYHEAAGGLALLGSDFVRCIGGVVCQRCGTAVCDCATDSKTAEEEGRPLRIDVIKNLEAFQSIWKRLEVLARSQPTDKYALVCALQQMHRVVAVTGDGTNDAPALRKADVGFAMGLSGKEVAKQAADIVMLDDNFTCIVKAVRWGRSVYDNIRRFLQFQLTVNVVAVLLTVTCVAVEREAPLSAVQMLWINLIMDSFASLALATEPPTDALLRRKPHGRDSYLVSKIMLASILVAACYQVAVMLLLIFYGERFLPETSWKFVVPQQKIKFKFCEFSDGTPEHCVGRHMVSGRRYKLFSTEEDYKTEWLREFGPSRHKTFVFNTFVFMQIFNMINARDVDDAGPTSSLLQLFTAMLRNKLGLGVWLFILLAQILMTELGGRVLGCHFDGLTPEQWSLSLLLAAIGLLWGRLPHAFPSLAKMAPELGRREELLEETHSLALELRGRTPNRINERLGLASYTFAKKYAKKARLMTLSRIQKRRQLQQLHKHSGIPSSPLGRGARSASALRLVGTSSRGSSSRSALIGP